MSVGVCVVDLDFEELAHEMKPITIAGLCIISAVLAVFMDRRVERTEINELRNLIGQQQAPLNVIGDHERRLQELEAIPPHLEAIQNKPGAE